MEVGGFCEMTKQGMRKTRTHPQQETTQTKFGTNPCVASQSVHMVKRASVVSCAQLVAQGALDAGTHAHTARIAGNARPPHSHSSARSTHLELGAHVPVLGCHHGNERFLSRLHSLPDLPGKTKRHVACAKWNRGTVVVNSSH